MILCYDKGMEAHATLYQNLLVSCELLPLREAAKQGDITAMYQLTESVISQEDSTADGETTYQLLMQLVCHDDFHKDYDRVINCFIMFSWAFGRLYEEGRISYKQYVEDSRQYLQMAMDIITTLPCEDWDFPQIESCLNWIKLHREQPVEMAD